ncbi:MAG: class I SAM-dependent methyltransferase [Candidatus Rifleibacteriota bacterium]
MSTTLEFYENNAGELIARFESAQLDSFHLAMQQFFMSGARLIEIGCGSGRDAARALSAGFDVQALDGAQALLQEAVKLHPELKGRLCHVRLPSRLPFADESFDGFFSVACLMHFSQPEVLEILDELRRILLPYGRGLVSLPARRGDVDNEGVDRYGRVFNVLRVGDWREIFYRSGFKSDQGPEENDCHGRDISWITFFLEKL